MSSSGPFGKSAWGRVDEICDRFEADRRNGLNTPLSDYVPGDLRPDERELLLRELLSLEFELVSGADRTLVLDPYLAQLPNDKRVVFAAYERFQTRQKNRSTTATAVESAQLEPGRQLGAYTILKQIGAGGMGHVYQARHDTMDREVALKVLAPKLVESPEGVRRFHREIKAAAKLEHPNIVTAHDAGEEDGLHYLVMQYVDGRDLASYVKAKGPLTIKQALQCTLQAARGLEYAHAQGIIHRDIKPHNLLVDRTGTVQLLDLGLARLELESADDGVTDLTASGVFMGTVDYMAPEQSLDTRTADARADIYSLGCTLYFLLTGHTVFPGDTIIQRVLAHREADIPDLSTTSGKIPGRLQQVFRRMGAKNPDDRFQTMTEVIAALQTCLKRKKTPSEMSSGVSLAQDAQLNSFLDGLTASEAATDPSALQDSEPGTRADVPTVPSQPTPLPHLRTKGGSHRDGSSRRLWLAGGAIAALVLLGVIVIKITTTDGKTSTVEAPSGSDFKIHEDGSVDVTLPEPDAPDRATTETPSPADEDMGEPGSGNTFAADRAVAEWVISQGGKVDVLVGDDKEGPIDSVSDLPEREFYVHLVDLIRCVGVDDAAFERLPGLPRLHWVWLSGTSAGVQALDWMARCPELHVLSIDSTPLNTSDLERLSRARYFDSLKLGGVQIDDEWEFLQSLPMLRQVTVWGKTLPPSLERLAEYPQLQTLHFESLDELDPEVLNALNRANPSLRILLGEFRAVSIAGDDPMVPLITLLADRQVLLGGADFHGGSWESTTTSDFNDKFVRRVEIPANVQLTVEELELIPRVASPLDRFNAPAGIDTDEMVRIVSRARPHLWDLHDSDLSDAGLAVLAEDVYLKHLDISGTRVTEAAVAEFRRQVPGCEVISDFGTFEPQHRLPPGWDDQLDAPESANTYAADREVAEWVISKGGALTVRLGDDSLSRISGDGLPSADFRVELIALADGQAFADEEFAALPGLPSLRGVTLVSPCGEEAIGWLQRCPNLRGLGSSSRIIRSSDLVRLDRLRGLFNVKLRAGQIDDGGRFLQSLPAMRELRISGQPTLALFEPGELSQLHSMIFLDQDDLDPDIAAALKSANPNLRLLTGIPESRNSHIVGDDPVTSVAEFVAGTGIRLEGTDLQGNPWNSAQSDSWNGLFISHVEFPPAVESTPDTLKLIERLAPSIFSIQADRAVQTDQLVESVSNTGAREWRLRDSDVTDHGLALLAAHTYIKHLDVAGTAVTEEGVAEFRRKVPGCRVISSFGTFEAEHRLPPRWGGDDSDVSTDQGE
ncbi:MAG: serine/threonine protein kinase [Planctomycetota bacterium]|nr:MAG: serine/threonine protein kinase [Planctomycetota bacterium]